MGQDRSVRTITLRSASGRRRSSSDAIDTRIAFAGKTPRAVRAGSLKSGVFMHSTIKGIYRSSGDLAAMASARLRTDLVESVSADMTRSGVTKPSTEADSSIAAVRSAASELTI